MNKKLILCKPNGFCAGVDRAVKMVDLALDAYGAPIYVNHEIVHNQHVVGRLADKGAVFVDDLDEVPVGARLIYSAHGVPPSLREQAKRRQLQELDATCPLVTKVHMEALRFARKGYHILLIGHADHVEVIGTYGEVPESITIVEPYRGQKMVDYVQQMAEPPSDKLIFLTQTTLNADDCLEVVARLRERWPNLQSPPSDDICYATTNRQNAVKALADKVDFFTVIGSTSSSNSKRLVEVAQESGSKAALFGSLADVQAFDLSAYETIGITAGASTPDHLVQGVIQYLNGLGYAGPEEYHHVKEDIAFNVPHHFRQDLAKVGIRV